MNNEVMNGNGKEKKGCPPVWRCQLIATVKKNLALRTSRGAVLLFTIPFVLCVGLYILFTVQIVKYNSFPWGDSNPMGQFIIFYYVMSLPSLVVMGKEKGSGMRDLMLQSGLPRWIHIASWLVVDGLIAFIASLVFAITTLPGFFEGIKSTSLLVPWLYFFLVLITCTPMNLLTIEIMPMARLQPILSFLIICLPTYLTINPPHGGDLSLPVKNVLCLIPGVAYNLAASVFTAFLQDKDSFINPDKYSLKMNHFYSTVNPSDVVPIDQSGGVYTTNQSIGNLFALELAGFFIFLFIAVWLEMLISGGIAVFKWPTKMYDAANMEDENAASNEDVEPHSLTEASSLRSGKGVVVRNLVKKFGNFTAVNKFSIDFLHDQVTVLLGPNGAGKTTVVNCLTGFTNKSGGTIMVNGQYIDSSRKDCRLGYCPQHNVSYDNLTTKQHLKLFAGIRGLHGDDIERACDEALISLRMPEKQNTWASDLSCGQKRRLNIALACIGNPDAIVLDEPTVGIDPFSRRQCWDLILEYRSRRTIILTTHFMDEAEILGDRIAIMTNGKLRAAGSCLFLKKRFSVGYTLNVTLRKMETAPSDYVTKDVTNTLLDAVQEHAPGASILYAKSMGATIKLPIEADKHMAELMRMLETNGPSLGIVDLSLGATSLAAVFISVAQEEAEEKSGKRRTPYSDNTISAEMGGLEYAAIPVFPPTITHSQLQRMRFFSICLFHFHRKLRHPYAQFFQILVPWALIIVVAMLYDGTRYAQNSPLGLILGFLIFHVCNSLVGVMSADRSCGYKSRLMLSGVTPHTYYFGLIAAELTVVWIITTFSIIPLYRGKSMVMFNAEAQITLAALVIFYASTFLIVICSALDSRPPLGENLNVSVFSMAFLTFALIPYIIITLILENFPNPKLYTAITTISWIFRCISPLYNCVYGLYHVNGVAIFATDSDPSGWNGVFTTENAWSTTGGGALVDIVFILVHSVLFTSLLYGLDMGMFKRKKFSTTNIPWDSDITEAKPVDVDVLNEEKLAMESSSAPLCIQGVRMMYGRGKCIAVRSASFTVGRGECLGLLGINGAGKTTIMNIAAGQLVPSEGAALLRGVNPIENPSIVAERLALNPQHDDLFPEFTVRENITFCAVMCGVTKGATLTVWAQKYIELNGLTEHADKLSRNLSGGNKRKLNLACALIGTRDVILLDEPAAGLDPVARCVMGGVIREAGKNSAVLYTSHCMEQAEDLCSRISIMKEGRIKAIGSLSRLKQRFSQGLVLEARISYVTPEEVRRSAEEHNVSLSVTIYPTAVQILATLQQLQVTIPHQHILATAFIVNAVEVGRHPIITEDLISLVLAEERKEALKLFVKEQFLGSRVVELQSSSITFHLPTTEDSLISNAFEKMKSCPESAHLEDFVVKHSSLDMVFTSFAKTGTDAVNENEFGLKS